MTEQDRRCRGVDSLQAQVLRPFLPLIRLLDKSPVGARRQARGVISMIDFYQNNYPDEQDKIWAQETRDEIGPRTLFHRLVEVDGGIRRLPYIVDPEKEEDRIHMSYLAAQLRSSKQNNPANLPSILDEAVKRRAAYQ